MTRAHLRFGAAVLASVCTVYAADRGRLESAAELMKESEASALNDIDADVRFNAGWALAIIGEPR